jgi:hypothetical protein
MNERIKQFAEQAGGEFYEGFAGSPNAVRFMETDLEKFAEAIVRECASMAVDEADKCGEQSSEMAGYAIRQHFGVEE